MSTHDYLPLDAMLDAFVAAMRQKFLDRADRQRALGRKSVTDEDFDFDTLRDLAAAIRQHTLDEISEWRTAPTEVRRREEAVDVANMMFLEWVAHER